MRTMTFEDLMNDVAGAEFSPLIIKESAESASVLAGCNVHTLFRPHFVNTSAGEHGVRRLIVEILRDNPAGMTVEEIAAEGWRRYTAERYPQKTYGDVIGKWMSEAGQTEAVAVRRLDGRGRPRKVWRLTAAERERLARKGAVPAGR